MKEYKRLTEKDIPLSVVRNIKHETFYYRLRELEDKIESGELRDTEEIRKETAKEILENVNILIKEALLAQRLGGVYPLEEAFTELAEKYGVEVEK